MITTSVVITLFNRKRLLGEVLAGYSLYGFHEGVELVLVDAGSTDGPRGLVDSARHVFQAIRFVEIDPSRCSVPVNMACRNPALGINVGVHRARGELIILTSPECVPLTDNIRRMRKIMDSGKRRAYCFGKMFKAVQGLTPLMENGTIDLSREEDIRKAITYGMLAEDISTARKYPYPYFAGLRKADYEAVNGIDLEFVKGVCCEDDDFSYRLKRFGVPWEWTDDCCVAHLWHPSVKASVPPEDYERNCERLRFNNSRKAIRVNDGGDYGEAHTVKADDLYA